MVINAYTLDELKSKLSKTDWLRVDAMTDKEITLAAESDNDNPPPSDEILKGLRSVREVCPDVFTNVRGFQKSPTKQHISIRLDRHVVSFFKSTGPNWQTRINEALNEWMHKHYC